MAAGVEVAALTAPLGLPPGGCVAYNESCHYHRADRCSQAHAHVGDTPEQVGIQMTNCGNICEEERAVWQRIRCALVAFFCSLLGAAIFVAFSRRIFQNSRSLSTGHSIPTDSALSFHGPIPLQGVRQKSWPLAVL